jgi:NADH-quinone oxidoreductase subunit N
MTSPLSLASVPSFRYAVPEVALGLAPLAVLAWGMWGGSARARRAGVVAIALGALAVSAGASAMELVQTPRLPLPAFLFDGQLACDAYACVFRVFFAAVTALVVVASIPTRELTIDRPGRGAGAEYVALLLVVCLGLNLMAMGRTLLVLYVAIEMVSVPSFVLAGFKRGDRRSSEAALKYVVYGGVASGVMLYGMSWLYGLSRSLALGDIAERMRTLTHDQGHVPNALAVGLACVMVGFAYKIAAVPFHMWAPDVYQGAPTLVAGFLSVGPKAAGMAMLVRFFREAVSSQLSLPEKQAPWPVVAGAIAVATMTLGNLSAFGQTSLKRLLAYSSIAHAGTMLLAFAVFDDEGAVAIGFYLAVYALMNLGAFLVAQSLDEALGTDAIESLRGLGARAPGTAATLAVFLLSLVGLPPFAGFVGKLYVFAALLRGEGDYRSWYFFLAIAGALNTVIAFFYYARILRLMYLAPVPAGEGKPVSVRGLHSVMAAMLVVPTVMLGVWWGPLYDFLARTMAKAP